jgi:polyferredoxin
MLIRVSHECEKGCAMNKREFIIVAGLVLLVVAGSIATQGRRLVEDRTATVAYSPDKTLGEIAETNGVLPSELKYCLQYELRKGTVVTLFQKAGQSAVPEPAVRRAIVRAWDDDPLRFVIRFVLWAALLAWVVLWLMRQRKVATIRKWVIIGVWFFFGAWLGVSPNPLESFVALIQWLADRQGGPVLIIGTLVLMAVLSVWGAKLLCGWGCPLGALQEMFFYFRLFPAKYLFKFPFWLSLAVRILLLAAFLAILFGGWTVLGQTNLYQPVNYFKLFRLPQLTPAILCSLPVLGVLSVLMFRPFCQLVCPFGLLAWLLEKVSFYRIHINAKRCTQCLKCVKACPTQAMRRIYENKTLLPPDCWSCGDCIESCPARAVAYKLPG